MLAQKRLYLLDTNTITYIVMGRSQEVRKFYRQAERDGAIGVSAITEAELRYGLEKKPEATRLRGYVTEFLGRTDCFAWDTAAAQMFSTLRAKTEAQGMAFGAFDLLIAAHALALGATLVTHDRVLRRTAEFVSIVDWATDI